MLAPIPVTLDNSWGLDHGDPDDPHSAQAYTEKALLAALKGRYREADGYIPLREGRSLSLQLLCGAPYIALQGRSEEAMKWLTLWANGFHPSYPTYVRERFLDRIRQYGPFMQFMTDMKRRCERYRREFG